MGVCEYERSKLLTVMNLSGDFVRGQELEAQASCGQGRSQSVAIEQTPLRRQPCPDLPGEGHEIRPETSEANMTGNTNGNSQRRARQESLKQRGSLLRVKRVPRDRNKTKGGDTPKTRDRGRGI